MKARTLLKKLKDHGLTVSKLGSKIRLTPGKLVNEKVLSFVKTYKNDLLWALEQEETERHIHQKKRLKEGRLEVLKLILHRHFKPEQTSRDDLENLLNTTLKQFQYDIETAIDYFRDIAPPIKSISLICLTCGYRPLFCTCKREVNHAPK